MKDLYYASEDRKNPVLFSGSFIIIIILFAIAYNQSPLYTSNQYQYFLHGLAQAGVGTLSEDWLANTLDPTPLFSLLVRLTIVFQANWLFYIYYGVLLGIYLFSLFCIVCKVIPINKNRNSTLLFITAMFLFHSAGLRFLLSRSLGPEWIYIFEGGVAGQRILGPVFQPSVFGVLILLSIALYLYDKPFMAVPAAVIAALVHPTYILSAGILILAYMFDQYFKTRNLKTTFYLGGSALVLVLPSVVYTLSVFGSGTPEITSRAHEILVNIRIPHHAQIKEWADITVLVKLIFLFIGLIICRRKRLFYILAIPSVVSILLTLLQLSSGSTALALLFPWRLSSWLIPVTFALILGETAVKIAKLISERMKIAMFIVCSLITSLVIFSGLVRTSIEKNRVDPFVISLAEYVSANLRPGDVYMVPVRMHEFRLIARAPIYVDFFSIPYDSEAVIEWYSRYLNADRFYKQADCSLLDELFQQGVTHIVLPVDYSVVCKGLVILYYNDEYILYVHEIDATSGLFKYK